MINGAAKLLTAPDGADLAPDVNALRADVARLDLAIRKLSAVSNEFSKLVAGKALRRTSAYGSNTITYPGGAWFVARMIEVGVRLARSRRKTGPDGFKEALTEAIDLTLAGLSNSKTDINFYIGLVGVSLTGVAEADVGIGTLRRLTTTEANHFSTANQPADTSRLCLVISNPCHWEILEVDSPQTDTSPQKTAPFDPLQRLGTLLFLAGARNKKGELRTPQSVWSRTSPFFFQGGSMSYGANPDLQWRTPSEVFDVTLTAGDAEECRAISSKLGDLNVPMLHTFLPRIIRASQVYNASDEDRLVDAAVAWEALFGSQDSNQLSLQLALAMTWLIEPSDHVKRLELFKKCKKIYGLRSTTVHGGPLKPEQHQRIKESAHDLLELLRLALLTIVDSHRHLLIAKDRTTPIILQIPDDV